MHTYIFFSFRLIYENHVFKIYLFIFNIPYVRKNVDATGILDMPR